MSAPPHNPLDVEGRASGEKRLEVVEGDVFGHAVDVVLGDPHAQIDSGQSGHKLAEGHGFIRVADDGGDLPVNLVGRKGDGDVTCERGGE